MHRSYRPLTAYNLFFREHRKQILASLADRSSGGTVPALTKKMPDFGDMARIVSKKWKALSENEKAPFIAMAHLEKLRHSQDTDMSRPILNNQEMLSHLLSRMGSHQPVQNSGNHLPQNFSGYDGSNSAFFTHAEGTPMVAAPAETTTNGFDSNNMDVSMHMNRANFGNAVQQDNQPSAHSNAGNCDDSIDETFMDLFTAEIFQDNSASATSTITVSMDKTMTDADERSSNRICRRGSFEGSKIQASPPHFHQQSSTAHHQHMSSVLQQSSSESNIRKRAFQHTDNSLQIVTENVQPTGEQFSNPESLASSTNSRQLRPSPYQDRMLSILASRLGPEAVEDVVNLFCRNNDQTDNEDYGHFVGH